MQPRDEFSICRQKNRALVDRNCPSSLSDCQGLTSLPGYPGHCEMDGAQGGDLRMQEIMKEALQETGLEGLRGRPVPEDGAGDRQLPGEAPVVRKLQESQAPGEEWPRVADTVPGHLEVRVSRVRGQRQLTGSRVSRGQTEAEMLGTRVWC